MIPLNCYIDILESIEQIIIPYRYGQNFIFPFKNVTAFPMRFTLDSFNISTYIYPFLGLADKDFNIFFSQLL